MVREVFTQVAHENRCALWDARKAMGGPGSILSWAELEPALAGGDGVHLTRQGYRVIAQGLFADLMEA